MLSSLSLEIQLKDPNADHILIPQDSIRGSTFFENQMNAHVFLDANPKFELQILCILEIITKNVKLNGIPENDLLCIFIITSIPRGTYFLLSLE